MDKKNTMLLTVIAVATLLVAVVGATFAYFSVADTTSTATSSTNVTTEDIGTVTLNNSTTEMHINTVAVDFADATKGQGHYYATKTAANYVTSVETNNVIDIHATGGREDTVYKCTFTLTAVTTGLPTELVAGDYLVTVGGIAGGLGELDMATTANQSISKTVTVYLTGTTAKYINASAVLHNTTEKQNYLANKTIETKFDANTLNCDIVATAGEDSIA